ncbi:hypothetical protein ABT052_40370 [Streptomyces sp. NPDC002766]|uniref:hypothetical protein n=1 Tax=Streptomyces sp. NPDC002766 TaxID=3154429 RepID=UPI00332861C6
MNGQMGMKALAVTLIVIIASVYGLLYLLYKWYMGLGPRWEIARFVNIVAKRLEARGCSPLDARQTALNEARLVFDGVPSTYEEAVRGPKRSPSRVGVKLRLIGLVLPAYERERYVEQWMDERNAIWRGEFAQQRFHGLRLLCGALVQSYETRAHARRSVD